ncbi:hypothetical protein L195_g004584 [Trifolium pratense]|uniref:Uncharacterized protein n=1 Tax=Trifolium pratense TaxID=57577 RepID=A0A2K3NYI9_TRIPR|nr:hypothetical protein L195_g004584 [Trifolium pratense]
MKISSKSKDCCSFAPEVVETAHPEVVAAETGHAEAGHHEGDPT